MQVAARRQLVDVSDEVTTRVAFIYYSDARDALIQGARRVGVR